MYYSVTHNSSFIFSSQNLIVLYQFRLTFNIWSEFAAVQRLRPSACTRNTVTVKEVSEQYHAFFYTNQEHERTDFLRAKKSPKRTEGILRPPVLLSFT